MRDKAMLFLDAFQCLVRQFGNRLMIGELDYNLHSKKYLTPKVKTYVIQLDVNFPSNLIT